MSHVDNQGCLLQVDALAGLVRAGHQEDAGSILSWLRMLILRCLSRQCGVWVLPALSAREQGRIGHERLRCLILEYMPTMSKLS